MLSTTTDTPRPRPPAKARRFVSQPVRKLATTPPPSYNSEFNFTSEGAGDVDQPPCAAPDTLLGSPMAATFQLVGWDHLTTPTRQMAPTSSSLDWMSEKSREEISELLVKADGLIREREQDIGHTSAVRKSLYENNVALKQKHDALMARFSSPLTPSAMSPMSTTRTLSRTPTHLSGSGTLSESTSDSVIDSVSSPYLSYRGRAARKMSVSPSDISLLADQNAELLQKLEQLETDSSTADQNGRRVLKRLEKEITALREELEKTQARSEELEEKAKIGFGIEAEKVVEEVWKKKKEREAKFKAMRHNANLGSSGHAADEPIKDFAPATSLLFGGSTAASFDLSDEFPDSPSSSFWTPPRNSRHHVQTPSEHALISKLLGKIQELEETNSRIIDQQMQTASQLQAVQRETEIMSKAYETLGDQNGIELELVPDDAVNNTVAEEDETIRFRSFQRSLAGAMILPPALDNSTHTGHKSRRSVVGLFDSLHSTDSAPGQPYKMSVPFNHRRTRSTGSYDAPSPVLSTLDISPPQSPSIQSQYFSRPTLQNELDNQFVGSWGLNAGNHHLRTNSLYDLAYVTSPSRSPTFDQLPSPPEEENQPHMLPTPVSVANLRLSVEPPTPEKAALAQAGSVGRHSARYKRMTETVRSRTHRWVDGRLTDEVPPSTQVEEHPQDAVAIIRPTTPLPIRLASAVGTFVDDFQGHLALSRQREGSASKNSQVDGPQAEKAKEKPRFVAFILEVWLWLQFCIIILVFLWAMAKKGPKSVLNQADHRRNVANPAGR